MSELSASFWKRLLPFAACFVLLSVCSCVSAQTGDAFGDDATDPVRLFERGQSAQARGEFVKAIGYYEQALKVRPEFPEAEFQRGSALASLATSAGSRGCLSSRDLLQEKLVASLLCTRRRADATIA